MDNNELKHYGVLGMKWGRRKKRIPSSDSSKTAAIRKKKIREMSNDELKTANNRLQLERNYKQLTKKPARVKNAVNSFIKTSVLIGGVASAAAVYKKVGNQALDKIGDLVVRNIKF